MTLVLKKDLSKGRDYEASLPSFQTFLSRFVTYLCTSWRVRQTVCTVRRVAGLAWFQSESSLSRDATLSVARRCVTERRLELDQMVEQRINS